MPQREVLRQCRGQSHEATGPLRKAKHENTQRSRDRRPGSGGGALQPGTTNKGRLPKAPPGRLRWEARRQKGEKAESRASEAQKAEGGDTESRQAGCRWVTSAGSCARGSRWRCWPPAAPAPPAQGRQGRHDAEAGRRHRADPGPRGEPYPGHEAGPGDRQGADLHRAGRAREWSNPRCGRASVPASPNF